MPPGIVVGFPAMPLTHVDPSASAADANARTSGHTTRRGYEHMNHTGIVKRCAGSLHPRHGQSRTSCTTAGQPWAREAGNLFSLRKTPEIEQPRGVQSDLQTGTKHGVHLACL